jgi:hypothetical protein
MLPIITSGTLNGFCLKVKTVRRTNDIPPNTHDNGFKKQAHIPFV